MKKSQNSFNYKTFDPKFLEMVNQGLHVNGMKYTLWKFDVAIGNGNISSNFNMKTVFEA